MKKRHRYKCPNCRTEKWYSKRPKTLPYHEGCHCLMEPIVPIRWSVKGSLACPNCGAQCVPFGTKCPSCDEVHH